jgi:hypothetical protein
LSHFQLGWPLNEKADEAQFLAIVLGAINLLYWDFLKDCYEWHQVLADPERLKTVLAKLIYTVVFTFFLHRYSKLYVDKSTALPKLEHLQAENKHLKAELEEVKGINETWKTSFDAIKTAFGNAETKNKELESEIIELIPWREKWKKGDWLPDLSKPLTTMVKSYNAK